MYERLHSMKQLGWHHGPFVPIFGGRMVFFAFIRLQEEKSNSFTKTFGLNCKDLKHCLFFIVKEPARIKQHKTNEKCETEDFK